MSYTIIWKCARIECRRPFVPKNCLQKYCSSECRKKEQNHRRRYGTVPSRIGE